MGLFGGRDEPVDVPPLAALGSLDALNAADLPELAEACLVVGLRGKEVSAQPVSSNAQIVLKLAKVLEAQPGETRREKELIPALHQLVAEGVQVLEHSRLIRLLQRGTSDPDIYLNRRGAAALASADPRSFIS